MVMAAFGSSTPRLVMRLRQLRRQLVAKLALAGPAEVGLHAVYGPGKSGQGRANQLIKAEKGGQGRAGQGRAGQGRAGQGRAGQGNKDEQGWAGQVRVDRTGYGKGSWRWTAGGPGQIDQAGQEQVQDRNSSSMDLHQKIHRTACWLPKLASVAIGTGCHLLAPETAADAPTSRSSSNMLTAAVLAGEACVAGPGPPGMWTVLTRLDSATLSASLNTLSKGSMHVSRALHPNCHTSLLCFTEQHCSKAHKTGTAVAVSIL